jgi:hypothetical protein
VGHRHQRCCPVHRLCNGGGASWYEQHREALAPILTLMAGIAVAGVALMRHFAQTDADRQRRITESYSKAVEQLGSDKIEMRLGGIYTLERISRESLDDYWTVIETLCAFVRERARWKASEEASSETVARFYQELETTESRSSPPTDIAAVLAVIARRDEKNLRRESDNRWRLDFREADLRGADLSGASLREATLEGANLSRATLWHVDLRGATSRRPTSARPTSARPQGSWQTSWPKRPEMPAHNSIYRARPTGLPPGRK